jgi:hypothetical protein
VTTGHITWTWTRQSVVVGFDRVGEGSTVLLLPALSSISTRQEMRPLQDRLASEFAFAGLMTIPSEPLRNALSPLVR